MKFYHEKKDVVFLKELTSKGKHSARVLKRANILLLLAKGETGDGISDKLLVNRDTVYNVKRRYKESGLGIALYDKSRPGQPKKYDDKQRAEVIATACTNPPKGRKRWSIQLLTEEMKKKKGMKTMNRETIRLTLKKAKLSLG